MWPRETTSSQLSLVSAWHISSEKCHCGHHVALLPHCYLYIQVMCRARPLPAREQVSCVFSLSVGQVLRSSLLSLRSISVSLTNTVSHCSSGWPQAPESWDYVLAPMLGTLFLNIHYILMHLLFCQCWGTQGLGP